MPLLLRDSTSAAGTWRVLTARRAPFGPTTPFVDLCCLLPSRFPSSKKAGVQRASWRLHDAGLSAVKWEGGPGKHRVAASPAGSQVGARHVASSRDPEFEHWVPVGGGQRGLGAGWGAEKGVGVEAARAIRGKERGTLAV